MSVSTYRMESKRILLSDKHWHKPELNEQQLGIIQHALYVLSHAFTAEESYCKLIRETHRVIDTELERSAYIDPLNPPR